MASEGPEAGGGAAARHRLPVGETIIAVGVLVLAAVVYWQTASIPVSPIYAKVGPTVVPTITALGLGLLGAVLLFEAWRGGWQSETERELAVDHVALLWIAAGLILNVLLIGPAGFTLASIIMFVCVARGFGSKAIVRDAAIAAVIALVAYFGFAKTLGINIGAGWIEKGIESVLGIGENA
jgi:putative tricarboxylic transport membrane protein